MDVAPGVTVNVHVPLTTISPQLAGLMLVPDGSAGDITYVTLLAVSVPVFVITIFLGVPVRAAFSAVLLTDKAKLEADSIPGAGIPVDVILSCSLGIG